MRTFSNRVISNLSKKTGLEVVLFVGVEWADGGEVYYSSTDFPGTNKSVVAVTDLETTTQIDGAGTSQSVTVTLSDTDGDLTDILNTIDIHKRPAKVYLGFPDVSISESVILLDGEINSEMEWDERARTLTFTILSKIEGRLFGFAAEDGLFVDVDPRSRSTPWPFRFGETCSFPTVEIRNGRTGLLQIGQGVLDATLDAKICQAQSIECPLVENPLADPEEQDDTQNLIAAVNTWLGAANPGTDDVFEFDPDTPFGVRSAVPGFYLDGEVIARNPANNQPLQADPECVRAKFETLCQLYRDRANQLVYVNDTLNIIGGEDFPQNQTVDIRIEDIVYTGVFTGTVFTIEKTNRLDRPTGQIDCRDVGPLVSGYRKRNEPEPTDLEDCQQPTNQFELRVVGGAGEAWRNLGEIEDSAFKWLPSGSTVHLETTQKRVHIVSLVPGTVDGVFAYRRLGDTQQLTEVPTDYYEVVETDYGDLTATEVWLDRALSSYPDENWQDKIYVQFTSDVGPNPVDIIEWIVDKYTSFTVDATNFAAVKTLLTKYPCNYYHASKTNVLSVLTQIAYEARCALTVTDNVVKLTYLPAEPDADKTLSDADLVAGSFKIRHTRTEDLFTSTKVTWQPWGAEILSTDTADRSFTVENNVNKYGYFGSSKVYDTISNEDQALKTATFWNIRESNTWRLVEFQTTLEHMDLELFDCIQLNVTPFPNTKVIVNSMNVNPDTGLITFECWTPILSGTTEEYTWAWPATQNEGRPYPEDNFDVPTPLVAITPPEGHPLYIEDPNPAVAPTWGDRYPSDLDDTTPVTICQDMNDPLLIDAIQPIFERIEFLSADPDEQGSRADIIAADGLTYNANSDTGGDENVVCGRNTLESCVWEVTITYSTATAIAKGDNVGGTLSGGGCDLVGGPCKSDIRGQRCLGPLFSWCRTFGSEIMANSFKAAVEAQIDAAYCSWRVGLTGPVSVLGPFKKSSKDGDPSCVSLGNVETGRAES